jgi:hypothetical protein
MAGFLLKYALRCPCLWQTPSIPAAGVSFNSYSMVNAYKILPLCVEGEIFINALGMLAIKSVCGVESNCWQISRVV